MSTLLLEVDRLRATYHQAGFPKRPDLAAVQDVSFSLNEGDTFGIVGESGCGKTTLGRVVLGLKEASGGAVRYRGRDYADMTPREKQKVQRNMGLVFQDSAGALNPRKTVWASVSAPLRYRGLPAEECCWKTEKTLCAVGLGPEDWEKYPHVLSGGQRQRVVIARAVVGEPELLVCDEAVSALDGMLRQQMLGLLGDLQERTGAALLFISHDLRAVRRMCRRMAVMYLGRFVEVGETGQVFEQPRHPYTKALLESVPLPDPKAALPPVLRGEVPSPEHPPAGCPFHPRCPRAHKRCEEERPELRSMGKAAAACFFPECD